MMRRGGSLNCLFYTPYVMRIIYPNDMMAPNEPDEFIAEEYACVKDAGIPVSLFSLESLHDFSPKPSLAEGDLVLYRGWMMSPDEYTGLHGQVALQGATMITPVEAYRLCHYLPEWYPLLRDHTPETHFFSEDGVDQIPDKLKELGWERCFIKDYVKSLSTGHGAVANHADEVPVILDEMRKYRGRIEGGICVRQYVELKPESERRFFVVHGTAHTADGSMVPAVVQQAAQHIQSPFYTVDTAETCSDRVLIIELGDGQVSDRKEWATEALVATFDRP